VKVIQDEMVERAFQMIDMCGTSGINLTEVLLLSILVL